jgi:hypothetical protein
MVACKELKRMFEIEDDGDESDHHADMPCKKYHKSVDLGRASMEQA